MNLSNLKPPKGARKSVKRVGRGSGSGLGKTSGRGHKGQRSRSGGKVRLGFEGGQMPLSRRLPKVGFHSPFRVEYSAVNVATLEKAFSAGDVVDPATLVKVGIARKGRPVKILANGSLSLSLTVKAHGFSEEAKKKIEAAGGSVEKLSLTSKSKEGS